MAVAFVAASSQYLENANAVRTAYPITMACWFRPSEATSTQTLMSIGDTTSAARWQLVAAGATGGDPVQFASGGFVASTSAGYTANVWNHACAVGASATDRTVYLNGGNSGTSTNSNTPSGLDRTAIGRRNDSSPGSFANGRIAEAAIWSVALTATEVAMLALGVSPLFVRPTSLVAYWPLVDAGNPSIDYRGGFDMTWNATPTRADHVNVYRPAEAQATPFAVTTSSRSSHMMMMGMGM